MSPVEFKDIVRLDLVSSKPAANVSFNEKVNNLISEGHDIAHFGFGLSPFPIPSFAQNALKEFAYEKRYLAVAGIYELRNEIAKVHDKYDGVTMNPSHILVGPGSKHLIYLTMETFNGVVMIPAPAWTSYEPQVKLAGKTIITVPTTEENSWKLTPDLLRTSCQFLQKENKLLILTNPGNPTGVCYTENELMEIGEVCRQERVVVISDEIYARIKFSGDHHSLAKYYPEGTIVTSGFSKAFSAGGWRIGYIYFPDELGALYSVVKSAASQTHTCAAGPMQYAIEKCLRVHPEEIEQYTRSCAKILETVSKYCHRELQSVGVTGPVSEAGYYFMPNFEPVRAGLNRRGIFTGFQMTNAILDEANVALLPSQAFSGPSESLCVRFCFVCFDGSSILENFDPVEDFNENSIKKFCPTLVSGVQRLKQWVTKHI